MVHILYEHPLGYLLMSANNIDSVASKEILKTVETYASFTNAFRLTGTLAYADLEDAQEQIEQFAEGKISSKLREFLEINNVTHLAADKTYNLALKDLGIRSVDEETAAEMVRGVKKFANKIFGVDSVQVGKSEVSLAHALSRKKIKYDTKREDNSVMQCISLVDEVNNDINDYYMKIKEMYSWHFPELAGICKEKEDYLEALQVVENRETAQKEEIEKLEHGQAILAAMENTIGGDLIEEDMTHVKELAEVVLEKLAIRDRAMDHLHSRMSTVAPNLAALIGSVVGARLILKAGGLSKLAMCPSSTIQVLGAEKALFRAMKSKSKTPKYGLIFHSSFVNQSNLKMRGRISRYLSSKCALASRIDCYTENVTDAYGVAMRGMVEERSKGKSTHHMPTDMVLAEVADRLDSK
ncbi:nucleolar protein 56 [Nematocida displodere]|uniref:Nucleolar protein 56 n=1 Tax=Nematocida displodere TaxID=1805483 RepID=A0A177EH36_9MICR|nr:nucleolar protein 56 [Nematocida displodere]